MGRVLLSLLACSAVGVMVGCAAEPADEGAVADSANLTGDETQVAALKRAVANVDEEHVTLPASITAPGIDASSGAKADNASLFGMDWYQHWAGGKTADHAWLSGSDGGRRCAWASIARFEAILEKAPPELVSLRAASKDWDGGFTNWNDDYAGKTADGKPAFGDAKGAGIWSTPSGAAKWGSATAKDGSCYLPTKKMLVAFAASCKANGSVKDCGEQ